MTSNEEIYLSYLCDRLMAVCNRINKKLDVMADSYAPLEYPAPTYVMPWQTTANTYFNNQPQPYFHQPLPPPNTHQPTQPPDPPDWQCPSPTNNQPTYTAEPYFHNQPSCWEPPLTAIAAANQPHQDYQQPRSDCPPQQLQLAQTRAPQAYPTYVQPTLQAADFRQPAVANVTPLTVAIPLPGSPDIIRGDEVLLDIEEIKHLEDERVMTWYPIKTVMSTGSGMPSADYDVDLSNDSPKGLQSEGLQSGLSSSNQHASRPEAMSMDFVVRPQPKVDPDKVRARAKQVVHDQHRTKKNKKLHQLIGPLNDHSDSLHVGEVTIIRLHSTTLDADA